MEMYPSFNPLLSYFGKALHCDMNFRHTLDNSHLFFFLFLFFSKKEYTPLVKIYTSSIPFSGRPSLDYPILHKISRLFILHFHICL